MWQSKQELVLCSHYWTRELANLQLNLSNRGDRQKVRNIYRLQLNRELSLIRNIWNIRCCIRLATLEREEVWGESHLAVAYGIITGNNIAPGLLFCSQWKSHKPLRDETSPRFLLICKAANETFNLDKQLVNPEQSPIVVYQTPLKHIWMVNSSPITKRLPLARAIT